MNRYPEQIQESVQLLRQMRQNSHDFKIGDNVCLARRVVRLLNAIPDRGGHHTPYDKIFLLDVLTDNIPCSDVPRFALSVYRRMLALFDVVQPSDMEDYDDPIERKWIEGACRKWADYIDIDNVTDDEWRKRYSRHLRFDPVERTERWEALYEQVEAEINEEMDPDTPRGMGFCFYYWSAKRDVLMRHGIDWRSPSAMNPGVMFD